jgi:hypothetical protein
MSAIRLSWLTPTEVQVLLIPKEGSQEEKTEMLDLGKFRRVENHMTERELENRLGGWVMVEGIAEAIRNAMRH